MTDRVAADNAAGGDEHIEVTENEMAGRYEVKVAGALAGFADRSISEGQMVLPHTVVDPRFRGRGLAAHLVRRALEDAREQGLAVVPACSYVDSYIGEHPEYLDLVAPGFGRRPR